VLTLILTALFLRFTQSGREIFAIGSNPHAATLRGINVKRVLLLIFVLTGALSGFAGFLFPSRLGTISASSVGQSYELVVISAVVIGGASVNGGSGTVLGTFLGCLLLAILNVALTMLKISEFWQIAVYGAAILLACAADAFLRRRALAGGAT
jgi:rhamnose transport system permease protein